VQKLSSIKLNYWWWKITHGKPQIQKLKATCLNCVPCVSPSNSRSWRGHNHLPRLTPLVGC
jgi:hypothetical protein